MAFSESVIAQVDSVLTANPKTVCACGLSIHGPDNLNPMALHQKTQSPSSVLQGGWGRGQGGGLRSGSLGSDDCPRLFWKVPLWPCW